MIFEFILVLEIIAFIFLIIGIIPLTDTYTLDGKKNSPPFSNRIASCIIAMLLFFTIALTAVNYDYNYCYTDETFSNYTTNTTTSTATCASYKVEDTALSYINWGFGFVSLIFVVLFMILRSFDELYQKRNG